MNTKDFIERQRWVYPLGIVAGGMLGLVIGTRLGHDAVGLVLGVGVGYAAADMALPAPLAALTPVSDAGGVAGRVAGANPDATPPPPIPLYSRSDGMPPPEVSHERDKSIAGLVRRMAVNNGAELPYRSSAEPAVSGA